MRSPVRVDRFVELVVAAHPAQETVARFAVDGFDSVVQATDADALSLEGVDGFDVVVGEVFASAVAVDDDSVDSTEQLLVLWPTWIILIVVDRSVDIEAAFVEAFG